MDSSSRNSAHHLDPYRSIIPGMSAQDAMFEAVRLDVDFETVCRYMRRYRDGEVPVRTSSGVRRMPRYEAHIRLDRGEPVTLTA